MSASSHRMASARQRADGMDEMSPAPPPRARLPRLASLLIGGSAAWLIALLVLSLVAVIAETNQQRRNADIAAARKMLPAQRAPRDIAPDMPVAPIAANFPIVPPAAPKNIAIAKAAPLVDNPPPEGCNKLGTRIVFHNDSVEAFKQAKKEHKLVFMMHLSGHFEDVAFT